MNADQWEGLLDDVPTLAGTGRRLIGYWFWEAAVVPEVMRRAMRRVDVLWAPTTFVADVLCSARLAPVTLLPLPIPEPQRGPAGRAEIEPLRGTADRFVFLVTFDHLSVMARKHPLAAIEAYRRAFPDPAAGTVLVVKTMGARHRPRDHERLRRAAAGRADIRVWDGELGRPEQMALIAESDCVVSLHRAEGLGLHLAEAMWLGTPTIATRWSGNLDLADDDSAALIDADLVPIVGGEGVYPGTGCWADPRLDDAADAMRRIVDDGGWRASITTAARARMERQPSLADAGRAIAAAPGGVVRAAAVALVVVRDGAGAAAARTAAHLRAAEPEIDARAVWVGDPQLAPEAGGVPFAAAGEVLREVDLVRSEPLVVEWRRALRAVSAALRSGAERVVLAWASSGAVVVAPGGSPLVLAVDADGVCVHAAKLVGEPARTRRDRRPRPAPRRRPARAPGDDRDDGEAGDGDHGGSGGHATIRRALALLAVTFPDAVSTWSVRGHGVPTTSTASAVVWQVDGGRSLRLPGGLAVDAACRRAVVDALADGEEVPAPWSDAPAFRRWLDERWWAARRAADRSDLLVAFPDPTMRAGSPFERWAAAAFVDDHAPFLVGRRRAAGSTWTVAAAPTAPGVNLVGYARHESGLGDDVRRLARGVRAAGLPCTLLAVRAHRQPADARPAADRRCGRARHDRRDRHRRPVPGARRGPPGAVRRARDG